jgi:hypothetical protein
MHDSYQARQELNEFKQSVNLVQYARASGYEVVKSKSCAASKFLTNSLTGDKVVVARDRRDEHWVYFSVRDERDNGSVVDFVQARVSPRPSLAQVRVMLREWRGMPAAVPQSPHDRVVATDRDRAAATARFMAADVVRNMLMLNERGLLPETLAHPQFAETWRRDPTTGNALFVHRDASGISGFEQKNRGFTGFSKGGEKTLWYSTPTEPIERLVIAESAIDALSYFQLTQQLNTRYMSVAGQVSSRQLDLVVMAAAKLPPTGEVVIAVDADAAGHRLYEAMRGALLPASRRVRRDSPELPRCNDWNDVLKVREQPFIGTVTRRNDGHFGRAKHAGTSPEIER